MITIENYKQMRNYCEVHGLIYPAIVCSPDLDDKLTIGCLAQQDWATNIPHPYGSGLTYEEAFEDFKKSTKRILQKIEQHKREQYEKLKEELNEM